MAVASPKLIGCYLGETSDDIEVAAGDLPPLQRYARELAEIALGQVAVRSASGAARKRATNEPGHAVTRWMITLARVDQPVRALGDRPAALPVATAFPGPQQPSKDAVHAGFASVILFGDQVPGQFGPWNWPAGRSRTETEPRSCKPP